MLKLDERETSNDSEPMQLDDAIELGDAFFDLLSSCRGRRGILDRKSVV